MTQIYNFEKNAPPVLNERMLRSELRRRKLQREILLLAASSLLILFCILTLAVRLYHAAPFLSIACAAYVCAAVTGDSIIFFVYLQKRRSLKC